MLKTLETAKHFIHLEYYDWENDIRGNQIKEILLNKAQEGVKVRVLYDDYDVTGNDGFTLNPCSGTTNYIDQQAGGHILQEAGYHINQE